MAKTNPYKIATWVLVGVLVLGLIIGFIAFGTSNKAQTSDLGMTTCPSETINFLPCQSEFLESQFASCETVFNDGIILKYSDGGTNRIKIEATCINYDPQEIIP